MIRLIRLKLATWLLSLVNVLMPKDVRGLPPRRPNV